MIQIAQLGSDVVIAVKAVPGSSRDRIAGAVGNRLKVCVAAPAEGGKANRAVCNLIAAALHRKPRDVAIHTGQSHAEKTVRIAGVSIESVRSALATYS